MNIVKINYWVDVALAIVFLVLATTGIFLIKGLGLITISNIFLISKLHTFSGISMLILVGVHLFLHWKWIVVMTKKEFGRKKK